jgi:hypothetical protein
VNSRLPTSLNNQLALVAFPTCSRSLAFFPFDFSFSVVERAYARSIERAGLGGSEDSKGASLQEVEDSSESEESSESGGDSDEGDSSGGVIPKYWEQ